MNLYEFALPTKANNGDDYSDALKAWEDIALNRCNGFTRMPDVDGFWRDGDDGKVYADRMRGYRIACKPAQMRAMRDDAFRLFPDQVALFVATIGTADIVSRPRPAAPLFAFGLRVPPHI